MIAAGRRRAMVARVRLEKLTRRVDGGANAVLVGAPRVETWTRAADRRANRVLQRAWPIVARLMRVLRGLRALAWRLLRPVVRRAFRLLGWLEPRLLRARDRAVSASVRASGVLTPERAVALAIVAAAACLAASQLVEYRAVEIGQPGYAGLPAAEPPSVGGERAGEAHSYLLLPVAALAALLALAGLRNPRRRAYSRGGGADFGPSAGRRGRVVFGLGAIGVAVALLVDMPAGLDVGTDASRFSGATAVLRDGFYAEVASSAALMLTGLLLIVGSRAPGRRRYRLRKPRLARTQGGLAKRAHYPVRERDSRLRT